MAEGEALPPPEEQDVRFQAGDDRDVAREAQHLPQQNHRAIAGWRAPAAWWLWGGLAALGVMIFLWAQPAPAAPAVTVPLSQGLSPPPVAPTVTVNVPTIAGAARPAGATGTPLPTVVPTAPNDIQATGVAAPAPADAPLTVAPAATATLPPAYFPVRLAIPSAAIEARVVQTGIDDQSRIYTPDWAAGHYVFSSKPGEGGNMVMVGHVDRGRVFNTLYQVKVDDLVYVTDEENTTFTYQVTEIVLAPVEGASAAQLEVGNQYVRPTTDNRLTLVTCWPEVNFTHRLIVVARPVN